MTLVQLEYVVALDTYLHFGEAAEHCFVTQPTLSMQIQKLEETLGVKLFERSKNKVTPTKIGARVIAQAKEVLSEARKIKELIQEEEGDVKGAIRVGVIPTVAPYLIPLFAPAITGKYPGLQLTFKELLTDDLLREVMENKLDLGIMAGPVASAPIRAIPLYREPFMVYPSFRHPLFNQSLIDSADLTLSGLWLLSEGHCFREQAMKVCGSEAALGSRPFNYESGSLEGLKRLVDKQGGYTLLPELSTLDFSPSEKTRLRSFKEPAPSREVVLVTNRAFTRARVIEALRDEIVASLPPLVKTQKHTKTTL